jgi:flavin-dependent dehydrogenase
MKSFDVVVVGAGPAGGQCARLLAKGGYNVLLVEKAIDFLKNNFSSAGTPLETLEHFELPDYIVGSFWQKIVIVTTNLHEEWEASQPLGAVLDFAKLREFLANEVKTHGGEVWMGYRYVNHIEQGEQTVVYLKSSSEHNEIAISTKVLVDATGPARSVMYEKKSDQPFFLSATGSEYLIEVEKNYYHNYANSLTFFLGHKWIPKGYSWVFPMETNKLKVGAGYLNTEHQIVKHTDGLKYYIELIINNHINNHTYKILDIHGSTLKYSQGLKDIYYKNHLIAIGDAVSTVNFLGGEGIRYAMQSAEIAVKYIQKYLNYEILSFKDYSKEMHKVFYKKWKLTEIIGRKKYLQDNDILIDETIKSLKTLNLEDIVDILFYYKFSKLYKKSWKRIWKMLIYYLWR